MLSRMGFGFSPCCAGTGDGAVAVSLSCGKELCCDDLNPRSRDIVVGQTYSGSDIVEVGVFASPQASRARRLRLLSNNAVPRPAAPLQLGYYRRRGLGAALRMMLFYRGHAFVNVVYGADLMSAWFGGKRPELLVRNSCVSLPYVVDGDVVVTQTNTCLLYLGQKLAIDRPENMIKNHTILDQTMDLRNDLMKVVYPSGDVQTKDHFPDAATRHTEGPLDIHLIKLEGFCQGPFMCGNEPQSGDFHVFEMLDQHAAVCQALELRTFFGKFPKLKALYDSMRALPSLERYFSASCYRNYAHNSPSSFFMGQGDDPDSGASAEEHIKQAQLTTLSHEAFTSSWLSSTDLPYRAMDSPMIGYHKARGLAAPLRMIMFFKGQAFSNVAYGDDLQDSWYGGQKPELLAKHSCINLPFIIDGSTVVTQANTCLLYLGQKLAIDKPENMIKNHTVLDQTMDLRNDLMNVVYPAGDVKTKDQFYGAVSKYFDRAFRNHLSKLEGFCQGPFMCGDEPQSGDFHVFEMLDEHAAMCQAIGIAAFFAECPRLKVLYDSMMAVPALERYFASDFYRKYAHNHGLIAHFTGQGAGFKCGPTVEEQVPASVTFADFVEFEAAVDKSDNDDSIGLGISTHDGRTLLVGRVSVGPVERWNGQQAHTPELRIGRGDRIMAVNGCSGRASTLLAAMKADVLHLKVRRLLEFSVTLDHQYDGEAVNVVFEDSGDGRCVVGRVRDGLAATVNRRSTADVEMRPGDTVLRVNGVDIRNATMLLTVTSAFGLLHFCLRRPEFATTVCV